MLEIGAHGLRDRRSQLKESNKKGKRKSEHFKERQRQKTHNIVLFCFSFSLYSGFIVFERSYEIISVYSSFVRHFINAGC